MKIRLTVITALLLCTLFFACKKNDILNVETREVSAAKASGSTFGVPTSGIRDDLDIDINPVANKQAQVGDSPSQHTFDCTNIPSDIPFYINIGMIVDNKILIEYERNPFYTGSNKVSGIEWNYSIATRPMENSSSFFSPHSDGTYNKDNLEITIPQLLSDIKLTISGTCTTFTGEIYSFSFKHIVNKTAGATMGNATLISSDYESEVTEGTETDCICPHCSGTYTLILP